VEVTPPSSVLLVVGRDELTLPSSFGGATCVASADCVAVATHDGPTSVELVPSTARGDLLELGSFTIESEGMVSLRDVYQRELDAIGVDPGLVTVTVLGDDDAEPTELVLVVAPG
jgi:hypothetical protein